MTIFYVDIYVHFVRFHVYLSCIFVGEPLVSNMLVGYP